MAPLRPQLTFVSSILRPYFISRCPRQSTSLLCYRLGSRYLHTTPPLLSASLCHNIKVKVAVLHQAVPPPIINGVTKPPKPGGYRDSSADIAFTLSQSTQSQSSPSSISVVTPTSNPSPTHDSDWSFPDTEDGIIAAVTKGATHLWANTILFSSHPLQTSSVLDEHVDAVKVVGQPPTLVSQFDDKEYVNRKCREHGGFTLPDAWVFSSIFLTDHDLKSAIADKIPISAYPVIGKPIRGRGSHGVKLLHTPDEAYTHLRALWEESPIAMIEEYLAGEEVTVSVMPPALSPSLSLTQGPGLRSGYWSLPIIRRFNHEDGVAPYNGTVAVTANSRLVTQAEMETDMEHREVARECERVAEAMGVTSCIRVDCRRFGGRGGRGGRFALFDVNMKPNMTGPGRPGREDQASLTVMAAKGLGWDYGMLLREMLGSARSLRELRSVELGAMWRD